MAQEHGFVFEYVILRHNEESPSELLAKGEVVATNFPAARIKALRDKAFDDVNIDEDNIEVTLRQFAGLN